MNFTGKAKAVTKRLLNFFNFCLKKTKCDFMKTRKRKISSTLIRVKELEKFKGKNVEINLNINEIDNESEGEENNLAGIFQKHAENGLFEKEKPAWGIAVREKHENYRR